MPRRNCNDGGACTFVVENTADLVDTNPGDGLCRAASVVPLSYACTLRAAVMEANAREAFGNGPYKILLEGGHTYQLKIAPLSGTSAAHGDLDVRAIDVTIRTAEDDGQRAIAAGDGYAGSAVRIGKQIGNALPRARRRWRCRRPTPTSPSSAPRCRTPTGPSAQSTAAQSI